MIDKFKKNEMEYSESSEEDENISDKLKGSDMHAICKYIEDQDRTCLICIGLIKRQHPIWSCNFCYTSFHLNCIQQWIADGAYKTCLNPIISKDFQIDVKWTCPKCRNAYDKDQSPHTYKCYCGKVENPFMDLANCETSAKGWNLPHSCDQICAKKFSNCQHTCTMICHPGPCPPCPKMVRISCYCQQAPPQMRRCSASQWSCSQRCSKSLNCHVHKCALICHPGLCPPCNKTSFQSCLCGKEKCERLCTQTVWQCDKVCGKPFLCGHHFCDRICHSPPCKSTCPNTGERTCPCGKKKVKGIPCYEDISCCGQTCDKVLPCSQHRCLERCHPGPCGQCHTVVTKSCRCGASKKTLPCYKEYTCDNKCDRFRNCGVHLCKRKCCDGTCNTCEQICGNTLNCRNHKCKSLCHRGMCYPCPLTITLKCDCGKTSKSFPCSNRQRKPPICKQFCNKQSQCHHHKIQPHFCHFGACPGCKLSCDKELSPCGHKCKSPCHDYQLVPLSVNGLVAPPQHKMSNKRSAPWDPKIEYVWQLDQNSPCPPCKEAVTVECVGLHGSKIFECHEAKLLSSYSCGSPCDRLLSCQNHRCSISCHPVSISPGQPENCEKCERVCEAKRPEGCTHACPLIWCHPKLTVANISQLTKHPAANTTKTTAILTPQGCPECFNMVRTVCYCTLNVIYIECYSYRQIQLNRQSIADRKTIESQDDQSLLSCKYRCPKTLECGHRCPRDCHAPPCTTETCTVKIKLTCNCKRLKKTLVCPKAKLLYPISILPCHEVTCQNKNSANENQSTLSANNNETNPNFNKKIKNFSFLKQISSLFINNSFTTLFLVSMLILFTSIYYYWQFK